MSCVQRTSRAPRCCRRCRGPSLLPHMVASIRCSHCRLGRRSVSYNPSCHHRSGTRSTSRSARSCGHTMSTPGRLPSVRPSGGRRRGPLPLWSARRREPPGATGRAPRLRPATTSCTCNACTRTATRSRSREGPCAKGRRPTPRRPVALPNTCRLRRLGLRLRRLPDSLRTRSHPDGLPRWRPRVRGKDARLEMLAV